MNAFRLLRRIVLEISGRLYLAWHRCCACWAYFRSPYGRLATPAQRLRALGPGTPSLPAGPEREGEAPRVDAIAVCILVIYADRLSESTRLSIAHWKDLGFRVLVVNNASLLAPDQQRLRAMAWHVFERINIGQDIGAFKDAILWLHDQGWLDQCSALAICNDSMQWIPGINADLLQRQTRQFLQQDREEALFSHCSYQGCRHYQSFFQLLRPSVFRSRRFLDFWKDYQPITNRRHCIVNGELRLSRQVYNHLPKLRLLYSTQALHDALAARIAEGQAVSADELLTWMPSTHRTLRLKIDNPALSVLMTAAQQGRSLAAFELASLADLIESNNPTHVAAFLYPLYLGCPLIKKDLCFAGSFTLAQAIHLYRRILAISCADWERQNKGMTNQLGDEYAQILAQKGIPQGYLLSRNEALRKGLKVGFVYSPTIVL